MSSIFGKRTVLPKVTHSGMPSGSSSQLFIVLSKAFQVPLNFFHQKFWIPSIPGEVQFFLLFITFLMVSSLISISCISLIFFLNSSLIFSIYGCSIVIFSSSHIPPQNSTNLSIARGSPLNSFVLFTLL